MNGPVFFLVVNFIVAMSFATAFAMVARRSHSRKAALWLAGGFAIASLSAICELLVAYSHTPKPWALAAFAAVLCGLVIIVLGIAEIYGQRIDARIVSIFLCVSLFLALVIYDLPRSTATHAFFYQSPFAIIVLLGSLVVLLSKRRSPLDRFIGLILLVTGLHFFGKAILAVSFGAGSTAKDYIHTNYALISQSSTAVLMVAAGLTLLSKLILEIIIVQQSESELDTLSGLYNRRGFERRVRQMLVRAPGHHHSIILCDLDHFKAINDTYGHQAGDHVIRSFGDRLRSFLPENAVAGRIGGEEFAVFLAQSELDSAVLIAQRLRLETMSLPDLPENLQVTASFGVSALFTEDELDEAYREADEALYNAKKSGRNRVKLARKR